MLLADEEVRAHERDWFHSSAANSSDWRLCRLILHYVPAGIEGPDIKFDQRAIAIVVRDVDINPRGVRVEQR